MECSCSINAGGDSSFLEFSHMKVVKARKEYKCGECHRAIEKGENYESNAMKQDGTFYSHKTCSDCLNLRDHFFKRDWFFEMIREDIKDHIQECNGNIPESCISQLNPKNQAWVCDLIAKIQKEM